MPFFLRKDSDRGGDQNRGAVESLLPSGICGH